VDGDRVVPAVREESSPDDGTEVSTVESSGDGEPSGAAA
jgi:hypothetical protein